MGRAASARSKYCRSSRLKCNTSPARTAGATRARPQAGRGRKIPDLLIAAAAEDFKLTVLHYDADFDRIAQATGQRCAWVVPAGSVP